MSLWCGHCRENALTTVICKPGRFHVEGWTDVEDVGVPPLQQVREAQLGTANMSAWNLQTGQQHTLTHAKNVPLVLIPIIKSNLYTCTSSYDCMSVTPSRVAKVLLGPRGGGYIFHGGGGGAAPPPKTGLCCIGEREDPQGTLVQ